MAAFASGTRVTLVALVRGKGARLLGVWFAVEVLDYPGSIFVYLTRKPCQLLLAARLHSLTLR